MTGYCENCEKRNECRKEIGIIWGFCNTDFEPETDQIETEQIEREE